MTHDPSPLSANLANARVFVFMRTKAQKGQMGPAISFRAWIVRASRMSYREIGRSARNSIKLFQPRGKEGNGAQGKGEQERRTIMAGIELSALNSAFYARRATARSPCQRRRMETLRMLIARIARLSRDVLLPLFLSFPPFLSFFFSCVVSSFRVPQHPRLRFFLLPAIPPSHFLSRRCAPLPPSLLDARDRICISISPLI